MMIALGNQFTGVFTNSSELFAELDAAAASERDRVWRVRLLRFSHFAGCS